MMKRVTAVILVLVLVLGIAAASAGTVLRLGSKGSAVRRLQAALRRWGYADVTVDGTFGPKTEEAVKNFQRANGLNPDGKVGSLTLKKLDITLPTGFTQSGRVVEQDTGTETGHEEAGSDYNPDYEEELNNTIGRVNGLTIGSTGPVVRKVQTYLRKLGWTSVKVDGKYGEKTAACVKEFQQYNGLKPDGICGVATQNVMFSGTAVGRLIKNNLPTLRRGDSDASRGDNWVSKLQQKLVGLGLLTSGYATGYYNVQTQNAVAAYQQSKGLKMDGVAGPKTLNSMGWSQYTDTKSPTMPTEPPATVKIIDGISN